MLTLRSAESWKAQLILLFLGANPEPAGPPKASEGLKEEAPGTGGAGES